MKIVKMKGGLGNQLFQYIFSCYLQEQLQEKVCLDLGYYSSMKYDKIRVPRIMDLNIRLQILLPEDIKKVLIFSDHGNPKSMLYKMKIGLEGLMNSKYYFEKDREYVPIEEIKKYTYFDGYWQSWRYVASVWENVKDDFKPQKGLSSNTMNCINQIENENAVFIGIRRGDYLLNQKMRKMYSVTSEAYYTNAISYLMKHVENPVFYVFSDDIEWVKENMSFPVNVKFREEREQVSDLEELFIMASCKHAVISNSTFNWWGAWLISYEKKIIIAPSRWFGNGDKIDIIPPEWICL